MDRYEANCETGEITVIPLTDEEIAQQERDREATLALSAEAAAQAEADATLIAEASTPGTTITNEHFAALARRR